MNINFSIEKKHLYILILFIALCTAILGAVAYNSNSAPAVFGHSGEEIEVVIDSETKLLNDALNEIDDELAEGWSILLKGSEYVEESKTTITSTDIVYETDHSYGSQVGDFALFNWPSESPSKILFRVKSFSDDFCLGGDGNGDFEAGANRNSKCVRQNQQGNTKSKAETEQSDWIQMYINGVKQIGCTDELERTGTASHSGKYGHVGAFTTSCTYDVNDDLTQLIVETADWSGGYGHWEWELWYK